MDERPASGPNRVLLRSTTPQLIACSLMLALALALLFSGTGAAVFPQPGAGRGVGVFMVIVSAGFAYAAGAGLSARVQADERCIRVRSWYRTEVISRSDVASIRIAPAKSRGSSDTIIALSINRHSRAKAVQPRCTRRTDTAENRQQLETQIASLLAWA